MKTVMQRTQEKRVERVGYFKNDPKYVFIGRQEAQALSRELKCEKKDLFHSSIYGLNIILVKLDSYLEVL